VVWGWLALFDLIGGLGDVKLDVMPVSARPLEIYFQNNFISTI
jgi:hypothetical protein